MRFIDTSSLSLPVGWIDQAKLAAGEVAKAKGNRADVIESYSHVWRALKEPLAKLSHYKCYYCETVRVRDDYEVDHFRPKSGTSSDGHSGYWWLAFDASNLYFSCRFCNQRRRGINGEEAGGKGSAFPLLEGGIRAVKPSDILEDEYPALADPCKRHEPSLIGFNDIGVAVPQPSRIGEPVEFERARTSIRIYNLNHGWLRRRREQKALIIRRKIGELTLQLEMHVRRSKSGNHQAAQDALARATQIKDELSLMRAPDEEYSSLATHILNLSVSKQRPWISRILMTEPAVSETSKRNVKAMDFVS
ncbi:hypothetical protein [Azospirillum sp. sgz302134]